MDVRLDRDEELHTEWLQFRSRLFDTLCGLPTLPAVAEDVRRLIERSGSVHVVYLDLGRSGWQETQLGWEVYDESVREFAHLLGTLRETREIGTDDIFCVDTVRSDRFLVFLGGVAGDARTSALRRADEARNLLLSALREGIAG